MRIQLDEEVRSSASGEKLALDHTIEGSLNRKKQIEIAETWASEIQIRKAALRSGAALAVPWIEVRARLSAL